MNQTSLSFTVFFEDPFWIGLFEYRAVFEANRTWK